MAIDFQEIQSKLAFIHVLKLRGDYAKAIELCREILAEAPHSSETCCMMGDLFSDQQKFDDAQNWYELALEYDPTQVGYIRKIRMTKEAIVQRDRMETARKIGLPTSSAKIPQFAAALMSLIVCFGLVGYFLGRQGNDAPKIVSEPIEVVGSSGGNATVPVDLNPKVETVVQKDREILSLCKSLPEIGTRLLSVWYDPRGSGVGLTLRATNEDDSRKLVASAAGALIKSLLEVDIVAVRLVDESGSLLFVADMSRTSYQTYGSSPEALLPQVWPLSSPPKAIPKIDPTVIDPKAKSEDNTEGTTPVTPSEAPTSETETKP